MSGAIYSESPSVVLQYLGPLQPHTLASIALMTINDDMAALVGFACEAFFYGCYTILFAMAISLKLNGPRRRRSDFKRPLFIISILLYLSCSAHFALEFIHFYIVLNTTGVKGFGNITSTMVGAGLLISLTEFVGELILIYRCWVLWSKNYWVVLLPTLAAIASLVSGSEAVHFLLRINQTSPVAPASLVRWDLAIFIILVCGNAIVTTLIVTRIWYISPHKRHVVLGTNFPTGTGWASIAIVIESGMLYLTVQLVFLILFALQQPAQVIISKIAVQIYGIAPTLIFIRMSGLLDTPSALTLSGATPSSRPISTRLDLSRSMTASTGPGLFTSTETRNSEARWKPSGVDLESNFSPKFGSAENSTVV